MINLVRSIENQKIEKLAELKKKTAEELKKLAIKYQTSDKVGSSVNYLSISLMALFFCLIVLNDFFSFMFWLRKQVKPLKQTSKIEKIKFRSKIDETLFDDFKNQNNRLKNYDDLFLDYQTVLLESILRKF